MNQTGKILAVIDAVKLTVRGVIFDWDASDIPRIEAANDENQWLWSVPLAFERVAALMQYYHAQLWVHHDIEDYKDRKFAPAYYD